MSRLKERYQDALDAYKSVISDPKYGWGFVEPPTGDWKDKHWSRELRKMWPEYTKIKVSGRHAYRELREWCAVHETDYWHNQPQSVWYFSNPKVALMFKLSFGGN
jgi:hypothetical protein